MLIDAYFIAKPYLPWRFRMALRRWRGKSKRQTMSDVWPIDIAAGSAPYGWPGWPDTKQFAFVLTHDVETRKGYSRVPSLLELTKKYGFRASFNFVPREDYLVSSSVLDLLRREGFEVGVHGLEHDGKLYRSKQEFVRKASQIREVMQQWGSCGFRSPLMLHRLGWIHKIGCKYDASTFDVDPFEPQPDGVTTIFPFWVPGEKDKGYVELPYTLAQDFTLFKVLRQQDIDIWKKKLDWIVAHGGMALINVHPDYMCFNGTPARDEYPVAYYEEFLCYVRDKYGDACWHALPREVSQYYCNTLPPEVRNTRRKICMIVYGEYESNNRVQRYAKTLAERGDMVDVLSLSAAMSSGVNFDSNGVNVHHIASRAQNEMRSLICAFRHVRFLIRAAKALTKMHSYKRYDVIHVHNIPYYLVFAAWYPKLTGAKVILDVHCSIPDLFQDKYNFKFKNIYKSASRLLEKLSVKFVDHVIVSNSLRKEKSIKQLVDKGRCSVFVNHVDPKIFAQREQIRRDGKYIVMLLGAFQWHQGLDIGIRAFSQFKTKMPNAELHLYGRGNEAIEKALRDLVQELGLETIVKFHGSVPLDNVAEVIANADLGIVPKRDDSFGNEAYRMKIMEFMSQGVPVVAARTEIDSYYFTDDDVYFFTSRDSDAMAKAMYEVAENHDLRDSLIAHGLKYVEQYSWIVKRKEYITLIDSLSTEHFKTPS